MFAELSQNFLTF